MGVAAEDNCYVCVESETCLAENSDSEAVQKLAGETAESLCLLDPGFLWLSYL